MKVLHLFSNWKWTGPAEPALNLCVALSQKGVECDFACAPGPAGSINKVIETARDRGLEPILQFHLSKHLNPIWNLLDSLSLRQFLKKHPYDILHCHLDNDHRLAIAARRKIPFRLVRSSYYGEGFPETKSCRTLLQNTDLLIEPSLKAMERDKQKTSRPEFAYVPVGVDTVRFDPARQVPDARRWLNIPPDAFVVGIVARMQPHRRFEDFFAAIALLAKNVPQTKVIVVGRGTRQRQVGFDPVQKLGLGDRVHFPGYVDGENYVGMLKAFDVQVMLVPGTDGTCRAVREGMAMAKPMVVARRGMLPELVQDGTTGLVTDGSPQELYAALHRLATNRQYARTLGRAGREHAQNEFSLSKQADRVSELYDKILSRKI